MLRVVICFSLMGLALSIASCATLMGPPRPENVFLTLKGDPGRTSETRYFSNTRTLSFEEGQLLRDKTEGVDFSVQTTFKAANSPDKILKFTARTVRKDGAVSLHDLSFPELREEIDYVVHAESAKVLKAGRYPSHSVFFIPTLPLPQRPVVVGDTWSFEHNWISTHDQVPLRLEMIAILKDLVRCSEGQHWCADLELSGQLGVAVPPTVRGAIFESHVRGRALFDLDRGDVLWSEIRSREEMRTPQQRVLVHSCMISELKMGEKYRSEFNCQPDDKALIALPK